MSAESYRYEFAARAVRDLEKLPESVAAAGVEFVAGALIGNPHRLGTPRLGTPRLGKPLRALWVGHWSARRGDYRVIYLIDDPTRVVRVVHIDHRGRVYR